MLSVHVEQRGEIARTGGWGCGIKLEEQEFSGRLIGSLYEGFPTRFDRHDPLSLILVRHSRLFSIVWQVANGMID